MVFRRGWKWPLFKERGRLTPKMDKYIFFIANLMPNIFYYGIFLKNHFPWKPRTRTFWKGTGRLTTKSNINQLFCFCPPPPRKQHFFHKTAKNRFFEEGVGWVGGYDYLLFKERRHFNVKKEHDLFYSK